MAYFLSSDNQKGFQNKQSLRKIKNSIESKDNVLKKRSKKENEKFALGDQNSGLIKASSSKKYDSTIYVHEARRIRTKIPSSSNSKFSDQDQGIIHSCGNHNHKCMIESCLSNNNNPPGNASTSSRQRKNKKLGTKVKHSHLKNLNFVDNEKFEKENLQEIEESYWLNLSPDKNQTSSSSETEYECSIINNEEILPEINKVNDTKTESLSHEVSNTKIDDLPPLLNDQCLKVTPIYSTKTNLTYYSQEIETNRVDYDKSLLLSKKKLIKTENLPFQFNDEGEMKTSSSGIEENLILQKEIKRRIPLSIKKKSFLFISENIHPHFPSDSKSRISTINSSHDQSLLVVDDKSVKTSKENLIQNDTEEQETTVQNVTDSDVEETNKLKHTDSLILAFRKKIKTRPPNVQQPTAIRLFKKQITIKNDAKIKNRSSSILKKDKSSNILKVKKTEKQK